MLKAPNLVFISTELGAKSFNFGAKSTELAVKSLISGAKSFMIEAFCSDFDPPTKYRGANRLINQSVRASFEFYLREGRSRLFEIVERRAAAYDAPKSGFFNKFEIPNPTSEIEVFLC